VRAVGLGGGAPESELCSALCGRREMTGGARPSVRERGWKKKRKRREAGWAEVGRMEGE